MIIEERDYRIKPGKIAKFVSTYEAHGPTIEFSKTFRPVPHHDAIPPIFVRLRVTDATGRSARRATPGTGRGGDKTPDKSGASTRRGKPKRKHEEDSSIDRPITGRHPTIGSPAGPMPAASSTRLESPSLDDD